MSLPEEFLKFEVEQALYLQDKLKSIEPLLEIVSKQFSPTQAQYVIGPLLTSLTGEALTEFVFATTLADYVQLLLKWALREDRPFWWIYETSIYEDTERPKLRQHPLTCETSAGGPSGHSVMMTVILYLQGKWLANYIERKTEWNRKMINVTVTCGMASILALIWAARVYFGTHFTHQCYAGTTLALTVMGCVEYEKLRRKMFDANRKHAIGVALGMMFAAATFYYGLVHFGLDPTWSVRKALKYCQRAQNVKIESTPIYNIVRNLGCGFGVAICAPLSNKIKPSSDRWRSIPITAGFMLINSIILSKAPKDLGSCMFLTYVFAASAFHSYAMIKLVPKLTNQETETTQEGSKPKEQPDSKPKVESNAKPGDKSEDELDEQSDSEEEPEEEPENESEQEPETQPEDESAKESEKEPEQEIE